MNVLKRIYKKWLTRKERRAKWRQGFYSDSYQSQGGGKIEVEAIKTFKDMFTKAYPDGALLLSSVSKINCGPELFPSFIFNAGIASNSFVSARGISAQTALNHELDYIIIKEYADKDGKVKVDISRKVTEDGLEITMKLGKRSDGESDIKLYDLEGIESDHAHLV